jgi:uncharacterized protein HemX
MKNGLMDKNGSVLIGVLVALIIAILFFYGGFSLVKKNQNNNVNSKNTIDIYQRARKNLNKINKTTETNSKQLEDLLKQVTSSN